MHWINFPLLTIMIWSGLRIYWADLRDPYVFGFGGWELFEFFPDWVNEPLGLNRKLARGMAFHFTFGWLFALNGIAFGLASHMVLHVTCGGLWEQKHHRHQHGDGGGPGAPVLMGESAATLSYGAVDAASAASGSPPHGGRRPAGMNIPRSDSAASFDGGYVRSPTFVLRKEEYSGPRTQL